MITITTKPCPACKQLGLDIDISIPSDAERIPCSQCNEHFRWNRKELVQVEKLPLGRKMKIFKGKGAEDVRKILWIIATNERLSAYAVKRKLEKNYSIAYRTLKRLEENDLVREVVKVPPPRRKGRGRSENIYIYSLTAKGAVAVLLSFPAKDYVGLKSFAEKWDKQSRLLNLIKKRAILIRFPTTAIML